MHNKLQVEMKHTQYEVINISSDEDDDQNVRRDYNDEELQLLYSARRQAPHNFQSPVKDLLQQNIGLLETNEQQLSQHDHLSKRQKVTHVGVPPVVVDRAVTVSRDTEPSTSHIETTIPLESDFVAGRVTNGGDSETQNLDAMTFDLTSQSSVPPLPYQMLIQAAPQPMNTRPPRIRKQKIEKCPYYMDAKLGTLMYCGPGYEQFPIALGTLSQHQDICDTWDLRVASKAGKKQAVLAESGSGFIDGQLTAQSESDADSDDEESWTNNIEAGCLSKVLEILPEVKHEFTLQKIRSKARTEEQRSNDFNEQYMQLIANEVVAAILELGDYPKQDKSREDSHDDDRMGKLVPLVKGNVNDSTYLIDGTGLLANHFVYVPTHYVNYAMIKKGSLYDAYLFLEQQETEYALAATKPYRRHRNPRVTLEKKYVPNNPRSRCDVRWKNLVNELQAARQEIAKNNLRLAKLREDEAAETANLEKHKTAGDVVECQCCFDEEIALNRAVHCEGENMHWFCYSCVKSLAESQVGNMRYEMTCMDSSDCKAVLSAPGVSRAVPAKIIEKLAFNQQQAEISAAGIEGLEQCARCEFKGICDPIEEDPVFRCRNPDCSRVTCRHCHEDAHSPKSCAEAKKDRQISARHRIEEARSEAMIRPCPKCKVKMIKETGCNKMTCTQCGCVSCFVCKQDISDRKEGGYQHFNRTSATCKLYEPANFDRHEYDADEAERQAISKARTENADLDVKELQVETGVDQSKKAPKRGAAAVAAAAPQEVYRRPDNLDNPRLRHQAALPVLPALDAPRRLAPAVAKELDRVGALRVEGNMMTGRRTRDTGDVVGLPLLQHELALQRSHFHTQILQPPHHYSVPTLHRPEHIVTREVRQRRTPPVGQHLTGLLPVQQINMGGERHGFPRPDAGAGLRLNDMLGQMPGQIPTMLPTPHQQTDFGMSAQQGAELDEAENEDILMMPFALPNTLRPDDAAFWNGPPYNNEFNNLMEGFEDW